MAQDLNGISIRFLSKNSIQLFSFESGPRNQTLLYNLFDMAQARSAPMLVVGVSSKIDVVESMEKRVKSRFSHRTVHLRKPADFAEYCAMAEGLGRNSQENIIFYS